MMQSMVFAVVAALVTLGGGMLALGLRAYKSVLLAFCGGILIAGALLNVFPDVLVMLESTTSPWHHHHLFFACIVGFLCFYFLEYATPHRRAQEGLPHYRHRHQTGIWGSVGIGVHSYFDGFVMGQAFQAGEKTGLVIATAIILHKLVDGISAVGIMVGTHHSLTSTRIVLALVALAPILGVVTQNVFVLTVPLLALLLAWFTGGFLYLGACSLLPAAHEGEQPQWLPLVTVLGSLFIYGIHLLAE
jgi:zinc transporter, ZIP family